MNLINLRGKIIFVILVTFVPLVLSYILPLDLGYIPIIGWAYVLLVEMYVFPLYFLTWIIPVSLFTTKSEYGTLDWSVAGIITAIIFWMISSILIAFLVGKRQELYKSLTEKEKQQIINEKKLRSLSKKTIFFVLLACLCAISIIFNLYL